MTLVPAQITPVGFAITLMPAGKFAITDIVIAAAIAGLPVTQVALEVITQVIISLLFNVASA